MTEPNAAREDVLREAERWAAFLRRSGYPEAQVAPEYCIGNEIGPDRFFTRTVSVWAGPYRDKPVRSITIKAIVSAALRRLAGRE